MPRFSARSLERLETCDTRLQEILRIAIRYWDCSIDEGWRSREKHAEYVAKGLSKVPYERTLHSVLGPGGGPASRAVHVLPYPGGWQSKRERWFFQAALILAIGATRGHRIRWGGDWDMDLDLTDRNWDDLAHFEVHDGPPTLGDLAPVLRDGDYVAP